MQQRSGSWGELSTVLVSKKHVHFFNRTPIWRRSPFWFICFLSGLDKDSFFVFCFLKSKVVLDVWWFGKVAKDICQMVDNYSLVIQHSWMTDFLIGTTSTTCRCSKLCWRVTYWGSKLEIGWNTQLIGSKELPSRQQMMFGNTQCDQHLAVFFWAPKKVTVPSLWHESLDGNMLATFTAAFPAPKQTNIWDGRLKNWTWRIIPFSTLHNFLLEK